ncbi:hypothetical protein [Olleya sp. HaHaR_3_96]|uniref:hypothetical protein n=1 Tax=Olleya sp. HaHaR_3_96 TaxID=2745560 RepID=UPI001C4FD1CC|nr:hypothetical protein [Olleya sp. HaHaR_3_96]QXP61585.1 hypothetical protein H0I26_08135 [Olleya sp. HaHaR_3_96]
MKNSKDKILNFLSENRERHFDQRDLKKSLLPELNTDQIKRLLKEIIAYDEELMRVYKETTSSLPVQYSGLIDDFLLNGGFEKIELEINSKSEFLKEKELLEYDNLRLQKENLRLGNWDIRFRWLIALITFLIGFITKWFLEKN